ncbi:sensor histidine kinase [Chitinophaga rhizophila]|uniref:Histidine kinase n=1 Tax=Chitinophaga rhizophila TaxID=2866212 RepID=A0ABS7G6T0_9BACT|nr:histidine kinase [Chitinophaga rhizophila]MBW8682865.1 histidine kinase [Chitinophaga rhizophila]
MSDITTAGVSTAREDLFVKFLTHREYRVLRHLIGLFPFLLLIWAVIFKNNHPEFAGFYSVLDALIFLLLITGMMYSNMYYLIPAFFYKKRQTLYFLLLSLLIVAGIILFRFGHDLLIEPHRISPAADGARSLIAHLIMGLLFFLPLLLTTTGFKLFQQWIEDTNKMKELETKYLESELRELRNQINPHFLFNMLNNVNVMIMKDPDKASQLVVKLSDLLRYHLNERSHHHAFLSAEIKFITDFIELEKVRRDNFRFTINIDLDPKGLKVPAKIFVNFVENAVKHSADSRSPSEINIRFSMNGRMLLFECTNTKPAKPGAHIERTGIGIANIKRRLELLYGPQFNLNISDRPDYYQVNLMFPL